MFVGRRNELEKLEEAYSSAKGEIVVIYGRRRIGKSALVEQFCKDKPNYFKFEGIEAENTKEQIVYFTEALKQQLDDSILNSVNFASWHHVFTYVTDKIVKNKKQEKIIIFLDEIQWMAAGKNSLISMLKYFWDNFWKNSNVMLVICGSIASFVVNKVIRSKALYGRITYEILLKGLYPNEAKLLFENKRSPDEILKYLLIFGGVPKYLEEIKLNRSFSQNINRICFSADSIMTNELERIFYSQFKESRVYHKIASLLNRKVLSLDEISKSLKMPSGGGLKLYLQNLENAEIIRSYVSFDRKMMVRYKKYTLSDEYIVFYLKYISPNSEIVNRSESKNLFESLTGEGFDSWMGFCFERFCLKHAVYIADRMGFGDKVLVAAPYFGKADEQFQIDLIFKRTDKVITLCEVKYHNKEINSAVIPEMERKCSLLHAPKGYTVERALISLHGPDKVLKDSKYFHHSITLNDLFR